MDKETYKALKRLIETEKAKYYDLPIPKDFDLVENWIDEVAKEYEK